MPEEFCRYTRMQCDPVYMLPPGLLGRLGGGSKHPLLEAGSLDMEREFAAHCETYGLVGYSRGAPVRFGLLEDPNRDADSIRNLVREYATRAKRPPLTESQEITLRRRVVGTMGVRRGYVGWLITNSTYRSELAAIVKRWHPMIDQHGLPAVGLPWMAAFDQVRKRRTRRDQYLCDLADHCIRWRLLGLASLQLPEPLDLHVPVLEPSLLLPQMRAGGFCMFLPDIFPVPSPPELRKIGEHMQDSRAPAHLNGWANIVRRKAGDPSGVSRYEHVLTVHHYHAILKSRYPDIFKRGNVALIQDAIAGFLGISRDYVRKLLRQIQQRIR